MTTEKGNTGHIIDQTGKLTKDIRSLRQYALPGLFNYRAELLRQPQNSSFSTIELGQTEQALADLFGLFRHTTSVETIANELWERGTVSTRGDVLRIAALHYDKEDLTNKDNAQQIPIIGIVGPISSGKGTVGEILNNKFGFLSFPLSERLREYAVGVRQSPPHSRDQLRIISDQLKGNFGKPVFVRWTLEAIRNMQNREESLRRRFPEMSSQLQGISIDGFRSIEEAKWFKTQPKTILIGITASKDKRYQRLAERGREGDDFTRDKFEESDAIENEWIEPILNIADIIITNNGSQQQLQHEVVAQVDNWLKRVSK